MKRLSLIAVAASLVINAGALGVIASGIDESSLPRGQVVVTELDGEQAPIYAQADGVVGDAVTL
jgi:flagellar basal body P-ring protein FlgI